MRCAVLVRCFFVMFQGTWLGERVQHFLFFCWICWAPWWCEFGGTFSIKINDGSWELRWNLCKTNILEACWNITRYGYHYSLGLHVLQKGPLPDSRSVMDSMIFKGWRCWKYYEFLTFLSVCLMLKSDPIWVVESGWKPDMTLLKPGVFCILFWLCDLSLTQITSNWALSSSTPCSSA